MEENGNSKKGLIIAVIVLSVIVAGLIALLVYVSVNKSEDYKALYEQNQIKYDEAETVIDSLETVIKLNTLAALKWQAIADSTLHLANLEKLQRDKIYLEYEKINSTYDNFTIYQIDSIIAEYKRTNSTGR